MNRNAAALGLAGAMGMAFGTMAVALATKLAKKVGQPEAHNYQCIHVESGISKPSMGVQIDGALHILCLGCEIGYAHLFYKVAVKDGEEQLGRPITEGEVPAPFRNAFVEGL